MTRKEALMLCATLLLLLPHFSQQQPQPPKSTPPVRAAAAAAAPSRELFVLRFLGENSVLGPSQILTGIDWRYRKLRACDGRYCESTYLYTEVRFLGAILTIKCTNFTEGVPFNQHCPGVHYLVKRLIVRVVSITLGVLAAALGTCDMTFSKKFQRQRSTVLRQIPLSRRNTVMSGFDHLRSQTQVSVANCSSLLLFDVKDTGQREELMKQDYEK